ILYADPRGFQIKKYMQHAGTRPSVRCSSAAATPSYKRRMCYARPLSSPCATCPLVHCYIYGARGFGAESFSSVFSAQHVQRRACHCCRLSAVDINTSLLCSCAAGLGAAHCALRIIRRMQLPPHSLKNRGPRPQLQYALLVLDHKKVTEFLLQHDTEPTWANVEGSVLFGTMNQQNEAAGPTDKAFDIFRQPILQNGGNKRSTERYEFPPDLSRLSFGRGRNTPATTPQRNENRRPGDRAGSSDMSLDQSAMLDNPLNSAIIENPGATGLEALVITMLEKIADGIEAATKPWSGFSTAYQEILLSRMPQPTAAPLNYQVMPDLSKSIPVFTGSEDPTVAREWIENIRSMRVLHNWPEAFALETARIHLAQGARDWFSARRASLDTWPKFSAAFESTYLQHENMTTRWKRMTERVQLKGEHIQQYFHSKVKLCLKLNLDAAEIIEQVLIGLWSKDLFSAMSGRVHANVDALLHDIIEYEHKVGQRQERARAQANAGPSTSRRSSNESQATSATERPNARVNNAVSKRPQTNEQGEPRCFNCQAYGHISRNCPEPRVEPYCTSLNIKIDNATVSNIKCRLVSDENLPVEILVGRPFTDHETVKYVKEGDTLTFFQVDVPLTAPGLHLRARTDVTMLPNSINFIEIASSDGSCRVPATGNYPVSTRIKEGASIGRGEIAELPVLTIVPEKRPIKMEEIVIGEDASPRVAEELLAVSPNALTTSTYAELQICKQRITNCDFNDLENATKNMRLYRWTPWTNKPRHYFDAQWPTALIKLPDHC
ncbi:unnamed protein product, partial [Trichogramma brassicae]